MNSLGEDVYATLLLNDLYLPGALVLAHSLRDAGTTKKLAVFFTPESVSADALKELRKLYDYVIPSERINNEFPANLQLMSRPELSSTFTKIILWKQLQFRRIVYVDSDIVALRAPDELFDSPYPFSAAPDIGWPDIFNSGLMVLTPNMSDYNALLSMAQEGLSFDGADQGLLNMHFSDNFNRLSFTYNVTPSAYYQYVPAYRHFKSQIVMAHFIGQNKPWMQDRILENGSSPVDDILNTWWRVYDRHYETPSNDNGAANLQAEASTIDLELPKSKLEVGLDTKSNKESSFKRKSETEPYILCNAQPQPIKEPNQELDVTLNQPTLQREKSNIEAHFSYSNQYYPTKGQNSELDDTLNQQAWQRRNSDIVNHIPYGNQFQEMEEQKNSFHNSLNVHEAQKINSEEGPHLIAGNNECTDRESEYVTNIFTDSPVSNNNCQEYAESRHEIINNNKFITTNTKYTILGHENHKSEEIGNGASKITKSQNDRTIDVKLIPSEYKNLVENKNLSQLSSEITSEDSVSHSLLQPVETQVQQVKKYKSWDASKEPPPINSKPEASNFPTVQYAMSSDPRLFKVPEKYPDPPKDMWFEVPKATSCQKLAPIFPWEINAPKPTRIFAEDTEDWNQFPSTLGRANPFSRDSHKRDQAMASRNSAKINEWQSFSLTNAWDHVPEIENYIGKLQKHTGRNNQVESPSYLKRSSIRGRERLAGQLTAAEGVPSREEWDPTKQSEQLVCQQSQILAQKLEIVDISSRERK